MENLLEINNINTLTCGYNGENDIAQEDYSKVITLKGNQSFNESNLMTLPFISMKRSRESELKRNWIRNNVEVELTVKGTNLGCPTIYEMDVLMGLLKIKANNMNNVIEISSENRVANMDNVIHFTYRELARVMGFEKFGKSTKQRLEKSIKCLLETTIYSKQAVRNQKEGKYVSSFFGEESCRILCSYKSYNVETRKLENDKLLHHTEIKELQSVQIDDFFYNNMINNYFKLYDYEKYKLLKNGISKKIFLILTQWSHGYEKYLKIQTLYDYLGLNDEIKEKKDEYYWNRRIKEALEELQSIGFIQGSNFANDGVLLVFNATVLNNYKGMDKYKKDEEIVSRLQAIGVSFDDISKHCRMDTMGYVAALLRYIDYQEQRGKIDDITKFTMKGLPYGRYDVSEFEVQF